MRKATFGERLRYAFDKSLSGGTISLIGWLGLISLLIVVAATFVLLFTGIVPDVPEGQDAQAFTFAEAFWQSLMRSIDPGTLAGDTGWSYRILMFLVTVGGIFVVSLLISILSSGMQSKLEEFRKGRSFVVEENHTLILGWSSRVFLIISELVIANENQKNPRVVILAGKDKVEMEDEIRTKVGDTKNTRVVCRSGNPIDLNDLEIVNPHASKSIVILSPDETADADAQVIKMILAITNNPNRRAEPYHIVAEIRDEKNMEVARLVGKDEVKLILSSDVIARITVQTCMQVGLSIVYTELLDYDGDEIYFQEEPKLVGKTFGEALFAYGHCSVMGLRQAAGGVKINPPTETVIQAGDKIIAIAEDDDKVVFSGFEHVSIDESAIRQMSEDASTQKRILILGWNKRGETIMRELDNYVADGSFLKIVADIDDREIRKHGTAENLKRLSVEFETGDTTDRKLLDALDLTSFHHIIILCYAEQLDAQAADAKTMITLLHLRDIEEKKGEAFSIVSEMIDVRNRALAEIAKADDFIVSDELTGLLLTQISENGELLAVFRDLFDADGSEIYLKPAKDYIALEKEVNFYTVTEAAKRRGETAIGFRLERHAPDASRAYGVRVNPPKSETISFKPEDKIIVLAED
ncbi:MAG TPA: TrkA C-terminal domain-containing protein [Pyrinomonadaceae bacterium]|jgi:voltage-gated potassium channel Kch